MVAVKDIGTSAGKWATRAQGAATEYAERAQAAAQRWQQNAAAAQQTYDQAIKAAGVAARYNRGVQRAGADKYSRRISAVGADRFGTGVSSAQQDWQTGFQPYAQALASLTLSTRRPRGDAANYRRVEEVGKRLNATRLAQLGGASAG